MIRHTVPPPPPAPLWGEGRVRGLVVEGTVAAGTSSVSTAPPGPDPFNARRSIPRSAASRRAFGDAATRRPAGPFVGAATTRWLSTKASTSAFSILPLAVLTRARSTPCSSATLRASGEAFGRESGAGASGAPPRAPPPRGGGGGGARARGADWAGGAPVGTPARRAPGGARRPQCAAASRDRYIA